MGIRKFGTLQEARHLAAHEGLREKAVCLVVRGAGLLVFDHVPAEDSGVQVPAGGVQPGETPSQGAARELCEESGLTLTGPVYLTSYEWFRPPPRRSQICHAYAFSAPAHTPDAWQRFADGHLFAFRWAPLARPGLDWEMDAALPELREHLSLLTQERK